ncbi:unnamed protein product [Anisakis simplex]|uniref:PID domain-containing protein n=1 Tax=Anisakis simplex TaxID=6269 RepID=A0A158PPG0_ANISI|nr:unnamed protein product [Anisakis simplex]
MKLPKSDIPETAPITAATFGGSDESDKNEDKMTRIQSESTLINTTVMEQICYLGCAKINSPSSESEMVKIMQLLNKERAQNPIDVVLSIPDSALGIVRMFDGSTKTEMVNFPVHRIRFCARGQLESAEKECFALSFTQQNATATDPALHYCHVFRCQLPEAAGKALLCFANAFRNNDISNKQSQSTTPKIRRHSSSNRTSNDDASSLEGIFTSATEEDYQFDAFLEMKEEDQKKGFTMCPQEKKCFKLRRDREKRVLVVLQQTAGPNILAVKKCFGMLLAAGRNLRQSDMHLLDMQSMGRGNDSRTYIIEAIWDPHAQNFEVLNTETPRETRVFMTVAVDVILTGINEPVRFNIECKARIFHEHERFWYVTRRPIVEKYFLTVKVCFCILRFVQPFLFLFLFRCQSFVVMACEEDEPTSQLESNGARPNGLQFVEVLSLKVNRSSGFLRVASGFLIYWTQVLRIFSITFECIDKSIFEVVRFESVTERERINTRLSLGRSPTKMPTQLIQPADEDESDSDEPLLSGSGDVNRECSEDVLSAWSKVMEEWKNDPEGSRPEGLADLMRNGVPDILRGEVWQYLAKVQIDPDLTQTYRLLLGKECPSEQVILRDIHRTFPAHEYFKEAGGDGQESLFRISKAYSLYDEEVSYCQGLSFLAAALLLHMPEEQAFCTLVKIMFDYGLRDLFKLGFDVLHLRFYQLQRLTEDYIPDLFAHFYDLGVETHMYASQWFLTLFTAKFPLQMVYFIVDLFLSERENLRLKETILRLERENDDLAHELVTSKIELRKNLDTAEDSVESLTGQLERCTRAAKDLEDENRNLHGEYEQVKEMCRREVQRLECEASRSEGIISNYKQICSDLSRRLETQQQTFKEQKKQLATKISECEKCALILSEFDDFSASPAKKLSPTEENGCGLRAIELIDKLEEREQHIKQIELELAQTKLALVEAQCRNQDLSHQMNSTTANSDTENKHAAWFKKTISSIKEVGTSLKQTHERNSSVSSSERF